MKKSIKLILALFFTTIMINIVFYFSLSIGNKTFYIYKFTENSSVAQGAVLFASFIIFLIASGFVIINKKD